MADALVDFLLNNIKELLLRHSHLIKGARREIESLEIDLRLFNAFIKDYAKRRRNNEETEQLIKSIHNAVCEAEDVVDEYRTRILERRIKAGSVWEFLKFWEPSIHLDAVGRKLEGVKIKVNKARECRNVHHDHDQDTPEIMIRPPRQQKDVVGFNDVKEHFILRLTENTDYLDVISLTGMFGSGKTTLAWKIFNDEEIALEFPIRVWLPISQKFSLKDIFLAILKELCAITDDIRQKQEHQLAKMVAEELETSSFLIVMDDVWTRDDWDKLRDALPHNMRGRGKVLITSRIDEVGKYASCPRPPHKMRCFDQDESWELLRLEALRTLNCPPELEQVGKLIASCCWGLPLAVAVIGGILATKFSASNIGATRCAWEEVSTMVSTHIIENDRVNDFISLSYDALPYHLRACFLYLGMFPRDHEIRASRLIQMWIGEGFVQQPQNTEHLSTLEEIGEKYLDDLVNRNLVMIDKYKPDGKVKTCRTHDALRDFCRFEATNDKFFQEIKYENGNFVPRVYDLNPYRRLAIHSKCFEFIRSEPMVRARSFVCFSKYEFELPEENIPGMLKAFKLLRVLDVKPIKFPVISSYMFRLVHLRYVAFSCDLSVLPSKFRELWNLQTLIVDTTSRTLEVKANIWKMSELRHFKTNASAKLPKPTSRSHGSELQTLGTISVESCRGEVLDGACNLKKLCIRGRLSLLEEGTLVKMRYLEKLKLINDDVYISEGQMHHFQFPRMLRNLTLRATFLDWNWMSILGSLENLEVLKLKDDAFTGRSWDQVHGAFRKLIHLHIEQADLVYWNAHDFPRLRGLVLKNCEKLCGIPIGLAHVTSFQRLELYACATAAATSAKRIMDLKKEKQLEFKLSIFPPPS